MLSSSDLPGIGRGIDMKKADNGVWEATAGPVASGAYRYNFNVDGLSVIDPRNPATSEANMNTWSLVYVPGSDVWDVKDVPHGAVAQVTYQSKTLKRPAHARLHAAGLREGEGNIRSSTFCTARSIAMLLEHRRPCRLHPRQPDRRGQSQADDRRDADGSHRAVSLRSAGRRAFERQMEEFVQDFTTDVRPYVESNYRVIGDRAHCPSPDCRWAEVKRSTSRFPPRRIWLHRRLQLGNLRHRRRVQRRTTSTKWEDSHQTILDDAALKKGLSLVWFGCGKQDFLVKTSTTTVDMLKKHGFDVVSRESDGGHTWINWREYLNEFAPLLFVPK